MVYTRKKGNLVKIIKNIKKHKTRQKLLDNIKNKPTINKQIKVKVIKR